MAPCGKKKTNSVPKYRASVGIVRSVAIHSMAAFRRRNGKNVNAAFGGSESWGSRRVPGFCGPLPRRVSRDSLPWLSHGSRVERTSAPWKPPSASSSSSEDRCHRSNVASISRGRHKRDVSNRPWMRAEILTVSQETTCQTQPWSVEPLDGTLRDGLTIVARCGPRTPFADRPRARAGARKRQSARRDFEHSTADDTITQAAAATTTISWRAATPGPMSPDRRAHERQVRHH